jgi:hypothetical protein
LLAIESRIVYTVRRMKTKGATSHISVSLAELTANLAPAATVVVSRRWAEALGITGIRPAQVAAPKSAAIQVEVEEEKKIDLEVDTW